ncbi:hypothetical protein Poli38472_011218 [Pythium oligandrum]|uniref:Cytosolic carboxypeptidase-like protein 5 n=1 Tax=Pythium oligandrum TaxID=41045 RepID=A0A8K1CSP2_PYTOL|nr:hypothetical protein Poli38472_011218 [Pythium oligandrum]|eukprot:TMW67598.1 hypothetical protein Poli38472_011218 [Pythium oligandrum]
MSQITSPYFKWSMRRAPPGETVACRVNMRVPEPQLMCEGHGKTLHAFPDDGVSFDSRFDGGNLRNVTRKSRDAFHLTLAEDASAYGISTGYTTWFYFEMKVDCQVNTDPAATSLDGQAPPPAPVKDKKPSVKTGSMREIELVLLNMNNQRGLYTNGYTAMYCVVDASREEANGAVDTEELFENERNWSRIPTPIQMEKYVLSPDDAQSAGKAAQDDEDEGEGSHTTLTGPQLPRKPETKMKITFRHHVQFSTERVRFAFCYPYTYTKLQRQLALLDRRYGSETTEKSVYYHRDLLTYSLGGLSIELLTISSTDYMLDGYSPSLPDLFPSTECTQRARAFDPQKKKTVLISARVHPGETPANFILDGMLRLLLHPTDESAASLRRHFVFKIIPMLNPDGVCQGYYRTDTRGVNLNRVYESPTLENEPAVFATRQLLLSIASQHGEPARDDVIYLDLHAHSNHRGCFVYGNNLLGDDTNKDGDVTSQVQTQLYARLSALNSPFFDYAACSFDAQNMTRRDVRDNNNATTSRQGSSRVALYLATGLTYVYTIECNYNEGRRRVDTGASTKSASSRQLVPTKATKTEPRPKTEQSRKTAASMDKIQRHAPAPGGRLFMKFSPLEWNDVGIGCLLALLDLFQLPGRAGAVAASPYRIVDAIKKSLHAELRGEKPSSSGKPEVGQDEGKVKGKSGSSRSLAAKM